MLQTQYLKVSTEPAVVADAAAAAAPSSVTGAAASVVEPAAAAAAAVSASVLGPSYTSFVAEDMFYFLVYRLSSKFYM